MTTTNSAVSPLMTRPRNIQEKGPPRSLMRGGSRHRKESNDGMGSGAERRWDELGVRVEVVWWEAGSGDIKIYECPTRYLRKQGQTHDGKGRRRI